MTLTVTASVADGSPARVLVEVDSEPRIVAPLKVYRVHEDGSRVRVLLNGKLIGGWSGFDYHAPFNQLVSYVAVAGGQESEPTPADVFVPSEVLWLLHPSDWSLSVSAPVVLSATARRRAARTTSDEVLRRRLPRISWQPRAGQQGDLSFLVESPTEVAAVEALFDDGGPIMISSHRPEAIPSMWVQPGDVTIEPPGGFFRTDLRTVSFPWVECSPPLVPVRPVWTIGEATAAFPGATLADMVGVWATLGDSRIDRRA